MNNLDFSTQLTQTGVSNANGIVAGKPLNSAAVQFLDMLLGQIEVEETQTGKTLSLKTDVEGDVATTPEARALAKEKGDLNLLQLALMGQEANGNIEEKLAELQIEKFDNRVNQLTKMIDHLTSGLPANVDGSGSIEALVGRLQERLANLETKIDILRGADGQVDPSEAFPLLIATGLNPNQMTSITKRIDEVESKLGRELTVEDLIAGVGNIIPVSGTDENKTFSVGDALDLVNKYGGDASNQSEAEKLLAMAENTVLTDELANKLNALQSNGETTEGLQKIADLVNTMLGKQQSGEELMPLAADAPSALPPETTTAPTLRSNAELQELRNAIKNVKDGGMVKANLETLSGNTSPITGNFSGDVFLPENWTSYFAEAFDALGLDIDAGIPLTTTMQAAHAATTIQQAGQTHAATQMVASQMTKSAAKGIANEMTIQLDPPELGRVEIKLEFGPEKTIKASLMVEKPETFLLLQRDAGALEKALQEAGLDVDNSSLDFELAQDSYNFGDDGRGNNQARNGGEGSDGDANDGDTIETTMTWEFDPATGHTHYSILA